MRFHHPAPPNYSQWKKPMTSRSIDEDGQLQSGFQQGATEKIQEFIRRKGGCADVQERLLVRTFSVTYSCSC